MSFIWPLMLLTLFFIPLMVGFYYRSLRKRQQTTANLGPLGIVQNVSGRAPKIRRHLPPTFFMLGISFLLFGLARPEMDVSLPRVEGTLILAFDVSSSMLAEDLEPTRMEAAKAAAQSFVENQPSTVLIGVVAFSNGGLVVQPPTDNRADVLGTIERLSPQGGTSLGQGIFSSLNAIAGEAIPVDENALEEGTENIQIGDYPSAVIVLLTDGENTDRLDPLDIAQLAAEANVRIFPIGIGSPEGSVIEIDGYRILTQLNETALQDIASLTNGSYHHAKDEGTLREIYENIDLRLTIKGEKTEVTSIAAGIGSVLFLIGGVLSMAWFGRVP